MQKPVVFSWGEVCAAVGFALRREVSREEEVEEVLVEHKVKDDGDSQGSWGLLRRGSWVLKRAPRDSPKVHPEQILRRHSTGAAVGVVGPCWCSVEEDIHWKIYYSSVLGPW